MAIEEGNINEEMKMPDEDKEFYYSYKGLLDYISNSKLPPQDKLNIKALLRNSDSGKRFKSMMKASYDQMAKNAAEMVPLSVPQSDPPPSARLPFDPPREPRDPFRESKELVYVKEGKAYISKDDLLQIVKEELLTTLSFDKD
jgi:hypothetical protein